MNVKISDCRKAVQVMYRVPKRDILSRRQHWPLARKRQVAMFLARDLGKHELTKIGRYFDRDHSTVWHAVRAVRERAAASHAYAEDLDQLRLTLAVYAAQRVVGL